MEVWWSNRADSMDATLTRAVDLRDVSTARLDFRYWMNIEDTYDYAYVEASTDNGVTWQTLPGRYTTTANPNGQNYGNGYTGTSSTSGTGAPEWLDGSADLAPFAGKRILLRFEYVTDEAYTGPGFALADVRIPEVGFDDATSGYAGWTASGWLHTDNAVAQRFVVRVVLYGATTQVETMSMDAKNMGSLRITGIGTAVQRAVLVVSALAPKTLMPATFTAEVAGNSTP
jgi:hypothetical protein